MDSLTVRMSADPVEHWLRRDDVLAVFGHGRGGDARLVNWPLARSGVSPAIECWLVPGPVRCGEDGALSWARSADYLFVQAASEAPGDPAAATEALYRELIAFIAGSDQPHWLRAWNLVGAINAGEGDAERYRRFVDGRHAAFSAAGWGAEDYPAATAIGSGGNTVHLAVLAGRTPGQGVENPRQLSAWRYPRQYGPHGPAFARATRVGGDCLLISGTGSVRGHETVFPGDLEGQIDEILDNLDAVQQAAGGRWRPAALKAFLRRLDDAAAVERRLRTRWPTLPPLLYLQGDLCRQDLLLELEGVYLAD